MRTIKDPPDGGSLIFNMWTYGESDPDLVHAMDAFYR